jgi:hypothetical protein
MFNVVGKSKEVSKNVKDGKNESELGSWKSSS